MRPNANFPTVPSNEPWCSSGLLTGKRTFSDLPGSGNAEGGAGKGYLHCQCRGRRFESGQPFGVVAQMVERERTFIAPSPSTWTTVRWCRQGLLLLSRERCGFKSRRSPGAVVQRLGRFVPLSPRPRTASAEGRWCRIGLLCVAGSNPVNAQKRSGIIAQWQSKSPERVAYSNLPRPL